MLVLGLASSHAPAMFCPPELWPRAYASKPDYTAESQPHTARAETPEVIRDYVRRIDAAFEMLRKQLDEARVDAVVFIGDDQGDMFNLAHMPTISIFTGESLWGTTDPRYFETPPEASIKHFPVHQEVANAILSGLIQRSFDPTRHEEMQALGNPALGASYMICLPYPRLIPNSDIPIVPIFLNEYFPPLPTAQRCWDLGVALGEIIETLPQRVAVYASGGLSHDPSGPRAGWIDEPLDRWILERLADNEGEQLTNLFKFDSDTLRGGTGEVRAWITAAGACQRNATVVEYIRAHHAKTGLAFAYWPFCDKESNGLVPSK